LGPGLVTLYLSVIVLLPLAAVIAKSTSSGLPNFWDQVTGPEAEAALKLTVICSLIVAAINAVFGTLIAWVLVRDDFRGKAIVNAIIDLPFALPTIVASVILFVFYGTGDTLGINVFATRFSIVLALSFVTLPFVVRSVQPVLMELDPEIEEAAASLGARGSTIFRRIIFPNILPGLLSGVGLAFARALGEYGSLVLITGLIPFKTEVASVFIRKQVETNNLPGAAAVSLVLLLAALVVLTAINLTQRRRLQRGH
jgi:sulfate/thiosulfate transport system permease protein